MLSKRERELLSFVCLTNKQIARKVGLSWQTVQKVFANMKEKFGVKTRTKLLIEAIRAGEIRTIDCGFWNPYGQYIEDKQIIDLRKK